MSEPDNNVPLPELRVELLPTGRQYQSLEEQMAALGEKIKNLPPGSALVRLNKPDNDPPNN